MNYSTLVCNYTFINGHPQNYFYLILVNYSELLICFSAISCVICIKYMYGYINEIESWIRDANSMIKGINNYDLIYGGKCGDQPT